MSNQDRADMAVYVCQECGCTITDQYKDEMLRYGEWRAVRKSTKNSKKVAYWINTLYSPFVRFSEVVKEFLDSKDDPEKLQNFVNSWLAEPMGRYQAENVSRDCYGKADRAAGAGCPGLGEISHGRRRRAGNLSVLEHPRVGVLT